MKTKVYILLGLAGIAAIAAGAFVSGLYKPVSDTIAQSLSLTSESGSSTDAADNASGQAIAAGKSRKAAEIKGKLKIADIAGKPKEEIEALFGKPTYTGTVNPGRAACPCTQMNYQYGLLEIVYINGKADWITVNLPKEKVDWSGSYVEATAFKSPEFVYVKAFTN